MHRTVWAAFAALGFAAVSGCAMCESYFDYTYPAVGGCCHWEVDDCCRAGSAFCHAVGGPPPIDPHQVEEIGDPVPDPPLDGPEVPDLPGVQQPQLPPTDLSPPQLPPMDGTEPPTDPTSPTEPPTLPPLDTPDTGLPPLEIPDAGLPPLEDVELPPLGEADELRPAQ